jgi:arylsulfatase A-like enzyme
MGCLLLLLSWGCEKNDPSPNVVLVVMDTLRADHLSQYGYPQATSPGLDELTKVATRYTNAYAPSSWTVPSAASIHTGLHPKNHGAIGMGDVLKLEHDTLAELLQAKGWSTGGFSFNLHIARSTHFDQGFDHFDDFTGSVLAYPNIHHMRDSVRKWLGNQPSDQPVFMYLHPMNTHGPYRVADKYNNNLLGRAPTRDFDYHGQPNNGILVGQLEKRALVTPKHLTSLNEQYDTALRYSTDIIGEIIATLKKEGRWDNTVFVFTSDHGEELFDHQGFSHGYSLYEEVIRVPLFVKAPHQSSAQVETLPVQITDLFPTILNLAKISPPKGLDGVHLGKHPEGAKRTLYFHVAGWSKRAVAHGALQSGRKYIYVKKNYEGLRNTSFLFDLSKDPSEQRNLLDPNADAANLPLAQSLDKFFSSKIERPPNVSHELDQEALRALGYLD